jgi:hypothetical protein
MGFEKQKSRTAIAVIAFLISRRAKTVRCKAAVRRWVLNWKTPDKVLIIRGF